MESKLRLDMARKRKDLADAEARIYFENYQLIADWREVLGQPLQDQSGAALQQRRDGSGKG